MNIPEGMSYVSKNCLLLKETIYRLVQSAREFYIKLISTLKLIVFKGNKYFCVYYQNRVKMD
jgi:hypothetical protein